MSKFHPEELILKVEIDVCSVCGEALVPVYENNGFNEPGAEKEEFVGYELCLHPEGIHNEVLT